ncbi:MAG: hypothetical protein NTX61_10655 [Bacteroidetes bacterium]|nr:hypothetical protein [Bacteroidota bacterium]
MINKIIKNVLVPFSDFIYGFADMSGLLGDEFKVFPYGISIGKRLDDAIVIAVESGPTPEYYALYRSINEELKDLTEQICVELRKKQIRCLNIIPTVSTEILESADYIKTLRYKVSHKMVATRAGLGWIGKTDLFISAEFGPRIRLASILMDHPVESKRKPVNKSKCGTCDICIIKCPAQAANGMLWNIHTDRDQFFDAHKCRDQCDKFGRERLNRDVRICGICVSVCPFGKRNK